MLLSVSNKNIFSVCLQQPIITVLSITHFSNQTCITEVTLFIKKRKLYIYRERERERERYSNNLIRMVEEKANERSAMFTIKITIRKNYNIIK